MAKLVDGLKKMRDIEPFAPNLFEVSFFGRSLTGGAADSGEYGFVDSKFYCKSANLGSLMSLNYTGRNPTLKEYYLDGSGDPIKLYDTVSIEWMETRDLEIWNYHRIWMSQFYDRERDVYISGARGKKRNAEIVVHMPMREADHYADSNDIKYFIDYDDKYEVIHKFSLIGMMPTALPEIALDWKSSSEDGASANMTYQVDRITYTASLINTEGEEIAIRMDQGGWKSPQGGGTGKRLDDAGGFEI